MGKTYKETGNTAKALVAFQNAINCVPMRLYPRYQKVLLLMEFGHQDAARRGAYEIHLIKEKASTTASKEIKNEMRKMIKHKI